MSLPKKPRGDASLFVPGVDRRSFLQGIGACSLASLAVTAVEGRHQSGANSKPMIENLSLATFLPCIGNTFRIQAGGQTVALELIEAAALPPGIRPPTLARREPFSLVFRAPAGFNAPQSIYELHHDRLGPFGVFLVPIGPDATGPRYEAIFN